MKREQKDQPSQVARHNSNEMLAEVRNDLFANRREENRTYRECFGLKNPPKSEKLRLKYAEGVNYYLLWVGCPDGENIIEGWFPTKQSALKYAKHNGWEVP